MTTATTTAKTDKIIMILEALGDKVLAGSGTKKVWATANDLPEIKSGNEHTSDGAAFSDRRLPSGAVIRIEYPTWIESGKIYRIA